MWDIDIKHLGCPMLIILCVLREDRCTMLHTGSDVRVHCDLAIQGHIVVGRWQSEDVDAGLGPCGTSSERKAVRNGNGNE